MRPARENDPAGFRLFLSDLSGTGDNSRISLWLILMLTSLIGMITLAVFGKRWLLNGQRNGD